MDFPGVAGAVPGAGAGAGGQTGASDLACLRPGRRACYCLALLLSLSLACLLGLDNTIPVRPCFQSARNGSERYVGRVPV